MQDRQLASLMLQIGVERGIAVERIAEELIDWSPPTFVDPPTFRAALADAVEIYLRSQVEERVERLRRRFGLAVQTPPSFPSPTIVDTAGTPAAAPPPGVVQAPPAPPAPAVESRAEPADEPHAVDIHEDPTEEEPELPADATIVWTTRREPESEPAKR